MCYLRTYLKISISLSEDFVSNVFFWKLPRHIKGAAEPEPDPRREPEMEVVPILSVVEVRLLF